MESKIYIVTSSGISAKTNNAYSILKRLSENNGNINISDNDTLFFPERIPAFSKVKVSFELLK